jgi:hypothetical protein
VTDYGELAQKLSIQRSRAQSAQEAEAERGMGHAEVYERVKLHVLDEIEKANVEMRKRKLDTIERAFIPSCRGKLCLTYGSKLLCTVELQEAKLQIAAVISGPPNALEISRKEFPIIKGCDPEQIAVEIVSGLLVGEFS